LDAEGAALAGLWGDRASLGARIDLLGEGV
jgi:hypothetical protein